MGRGFGVFALKLFCGKSWKDLDPCEAPKVLMARVPTLAVWRIKTSIRNVTLKVAESSFFWLVQKCDRVCVGLRHESKFVGGVRRGAGCLGRTSPPLGVSTSASQCFLN